MRITNQMTSSNAVWNLQRQQEALGKLDQQYLSKKRISKPLDDPEIATNAIAFRKQLKDLSIYQSNNTEAQEWLDSSYDAMDEISGRLLKLYETCSEASNGTNDSGSRDSMISMLKECREAIYGAGSSDYNGRYLFTGNRVNTNLVFGQKEENTTYRIQEHFRPDQMQETTCVTPVMADNYTGIAEDIKMPSTNTAYRLILSYQGLSETMKGGDPKLQLLDKTGNPVVLKDAAGDPITVKLNVLKEPASGDSYLPAAGEVNYIASTGELVFSKEVADAMAKSAKAGELADIGVTYEKKGFAQEDLRPEHYFTCEDITDPANSIAYATDHQAIMYDINYSQKIQVNVEGKDFLNHNIGRNIDDILHKSQALADAETARDRVAERLKDPANQGEDTQKMLNQLLESMNTNVALCKQNLTERLRQGMDQFQQEGDDLSLVMADVSSRSQRAALSSKLVDQQYLDAKALMSANEDVDIADIILRYNTAEQIYNYALTASGSAIKQSLVDFL